MVLGFDALLDQDRPTRLLTTALQSGKFPHAYLFTGPEGVGKKTAAKLLSMVCNCRGHEFHPKSPPRGEAPGGNTDPKLPAACGQCLSCKKILSANHPDVYWISPIGSYIKVDQIRGLCQRLALKPYEAKIRLAVIECAHTLNPEAGNTLLKILEEPPDQTIFILMARQSSELLPTIVSRCRHIRFNPISTESIQNYLENHYAVTTTESAIIAAMSGGSLSRAAAMKEKDWISHRNWIINTIAELDRQTINYHLAFAEALARDSGRVRTALEIMKSWYRDLAVYAYRPGSLINNDISDKIAVHSRKASLKRLLAIIHSIETTASHIEANANARLAIDQLVIELANKEN